MREADAALASGEEGAVGELLRREGLYSSHLTAWRRERDAGELAGLTPKKRGRKPRKNPLADENARLQRENARLQRELYKAKHDHRRPKKSRGAVGGDTAGADGGGLRAAEEKPPLEKDAVMQGLAFLIPLVGIVAACVALGVNRASYYRAQKPKPRPQPRPRPARALGDDERAHVLAVLDSEPFMDKAPAQVYAKLLDDGEYLCSTRTMYRVLDDAGQVRERRAQRRHPEYVKPQLVATAPNQVWSWDIDQAAGPGEGHVLHALRHPRHLQPLRRRLAGRQRASRRRSRSASSRRAASSSGIEPGQLTVHADRGSPMIAKSTAQLYVDLGIAQSHSRPHVSNDNPYSEAELQDLKYRPEMPERFGSHRARARCHRLRSSTGTTQPLPHRPRAAHPGRRPPRSRAPPSSPRASACSTPRTPHTPSASCAAGRIQKSPPPAAWINPPPMDQIVIADRITDRIAIADRITTADRIAEVAAH